MRIAFREGFLFGDLSVLANVRLAGSRCVDCGIALFGERHRCENCSSSNVTHEHFSNRGTVFSYTIQRYPPPKPNAVPDPWLPRPLAWIDLADIGPRIMSPIECEPGDVSIGSPVRLECCVGWLDNEGREVIAYKFVIDKAGRGA
jgi:uncharacterized OB-fold protein